MLALNTSYVHILDIRNNNRDNLKNCIWKFETRLIKSTNGCYAIIIPYIKARNRGIDLKTKISVTLEYESK